MTRTVTHLYDTYDEAAGAVRTLEESGVPHEDISIVGRPADAAASKGLAGVVAPADHGAAHSSAADNAAADEEIGVEPETTATHRGAGVGAGATLGTVLGGGAGLLAGLGSLAIPGVGPVVAAGWLIATLAGAGAGAAAGGLLGSLVGSGVREEDAHVYSEGVRRGGTLVSVRVSDGNAERVETLLSDSGRVDLARRADEYRAGGWTKYDETAPGVQPGSAVPDPERRAVADHTTDDATRAAAATEAAVERDRARTTGV